MKLFLPAALAAVPGTLLAQGAKQPNVILFMVDDMGWQDTSVPFWKEPTPFNRVYETPNMERLAAEGVMFTQAYACSISSPSRCSLITGVNNARHRVTNWTLEKDKTTDIPRDGIILPQWNWNGITLEPGIPGTYCGTSFVETLRRHGYHTIHCGKAHLGAIGTPGENPCHFGFEINIAGHAGGGPATYLGEKNFGYDADGKPTSLFAIPDLEEYWGQDIFATEALTREAVKALDRVSGEDDRPFFLYMAHYAIHVPIDRDMRYYQKYIDKGMDPREAAYAALIEGMDKSLGDITAWLDARGKADDTIIIFMSDNGGFATASWVRAGELFTQNAPLRCGKGSLYEGGIRVPMIVKWPGVTKAGTRCDKCVSIEDFYPSILEMTGISGSAAGGGKVGGKVGGESLPDLDGVSFVPLLRRNGDPSKGRTLVWNYPNVWGNDGPGISLNCAIRKGDWKLLYDYVTGEKELYHIPSDIGESRNLASRRPALVRKLSAELGAYLRAAGADRPSFEADGRPCPWPDEIR